MDKKSTYYGEFGGQYVSESLMNTLEELYVSIKDTEAMDALMELCKLEGIIPAIEMHMLWHMLSKRPKK